MRLQHYVTIKQTKWEKLALHNYKLNVDVYLHELNGKSGICVSFNDTNGDFTMAYSKLVTCSNNKYSKVSSATNSVNGVKRRAFDKNATQMNSLVITNMRNMKDTTNLKLKRIINDINSRIRNVIC